jgi:L,D-transpeptidase catalytic domain
VTLLLGAAALAPIATAGPLGLHSGSPRADGPGHLIAYVRPGRSIALRERPFGRVLARVGSVTPFGSARALGVVTRTAGGRWLGVTDAATGRNGLVWADARTTGLRYAETSLELDVDLSSRTLLVRRDAAVIRRARIGIGRPGSPTPLGRFAVTDKLNGRAYSAVYGCCILALSAVQPRLPAGWRGGNRVAIHGTLSSRDFGAAVSAGCLHASDRDLRFLMRNVRLGTPVVIRP